MRLALKPKNFKGIDSLAKSYVEAESMLGNSLRFPSKDAGDADRAAFRSKVLERGKDFGLMVMPEISQPEEEAKLYRSLGAPEKPDGYKLPVIEARDGMDFDASEAEALRDVFHKANLTQKQYELIVKGAAEARFTAAAEVKANNAANAAAIKKGWGEAAPDKVSKIGRWLELNKAPANLVSAVKDGAASADSLFWLDNMMQSFGGEAIEMSGSKGERITVTPAEALARVSEIENRMNDMNPGSPEYVTLMNERIKWLERSGA